MPSSQLTPGENFLTRKRHLQLDADLTWALAAMVIGGLLLLLTPLRAATAKETTPLADYPRDNRGSCMMLRDLGLGVKGAGMGEVRELCRTKGIEL